MKDHGESWKRTEAHLRRAYECAGSPTLEDFHDYLDHNELELAADVLADFGEENGTLPGNFWEALQAAYASMQLDDKARRCSSRAEDP